MKKLVPYFVAIVVATFLCILVLANMQFISPPRLVIKFDGKPASHVTLILPTKDVPYRLNVKGSITARELASGNSILVPFPDGGGATVGFPQHGTKVVDFQGPITVTTTVQYFGLVSHQTESYSLTDKQVMELDSGKKTQEEILDEIRRSKRNDS